MIRSYALTAAAILTVSTSINAWAADPLQETHKVLMQRWQWKPHRRRSPPARRKLQRLSRRRRSHGRLKVVIVRDGPAGVGPEVARRKAYTAALQRVSTGDFTKRVSAPGAFNPGMYDSTLSTGQGGVPIKVGEDTIGGIAAAGAPGGDKDEACAVAGIDKIKDRLN